MEDLIYLETICGQLEAQTLKAVCPNVHALQNVRLSILVRGFNFNPTDGHRAIFTQRSGITIAEKQVAAAKHALLSNLTVRCILRSFAPNPLIHLSEHGPFQ